VFFEQYPDHDAGVMKPFKISKVTFFAHFDLNVHSSTGPPPAPVGTLYCDNDMAEVNTP
jgi:hypothetical protein